MKKACSQIVLCRACKLRKKSHLSNVTLQWDYLSCFDCYLNQEKTKKVIFFHFWNIDKMIDHRINHIPILKSNSIIILMFSTQLNQSTDVVSFFSILSTAKVNTSSIESISSISILSVLKRHFELRYRSDFSDSLNFLIMKCMNNVINSQQILKSRSYKKTINDLNRKKWIKIMKNEINFFFINEI
jgi:hypothetical protein